MRFDLHVEDQDHSSELLRQGRVLAAVSAEPTPVQGCRVRPLGRMRYLRGGQPGLRAPPLRRRPRATPRWPRAPCNVFNQKDQLQARFLRRLSRRRLAPPQHRVPSTHGFIHAALHGLGWGMNPDVLVAPLLASGELVELVPGQRAGRAAVLAALEPGRRGAAHAHRRGHRGVCASAVAVVPTFIRGVNR